MSSTSKPADDPTGTGHKARWRCPQGHSSWERTNGGIWCHACAKATTHNPDVDPQYDRVLDLEAGATVAYEIAKAEWPPLADVPAY